MIYWMESKRTRLPAQSFGGLREISSAIIISDKISIIEMSFAVLQLLEQKEKGKKRLEPKKSVRRLIELSKIQNKNVFDTWVFKEEKNLRHSALKQKKFLSAWHT